MLQRSPLFGLAGRGRLPGEDEEQDADGKADREVEVARRLLHSDPEGRGEHERDAEAVQQAFFHHLTAGGCASTPGSAALACRRSPQRASRRVPSSLRSRDPDRYTSTRRRACSRYG